MRPNRGNALRSPYAPRACNVCRKKKIKCTGERPTCRTCENSGYANDCSWGPEQVKSFVNREHVKSLCAYITILEAELAHCRETHGGVAGDYLRARPNLEAQEEWEYENDQTEADDMRTFHLEGQDLQRYGGTSVLQYAPTVTGTYSRFPEIIRDTSRRYVLMVEGVNHAFNPDLDWSRHLPDEVYLDRQEHDRLLDLVFKFCMPWCLRIVPMLFLSDMYHALHLPASQPAPKTTHYSPMLHNALMAMGTAFSDNFRLRDLRTRKVFLEKAKSYIDSECQCPNISSVHALAMIGNFYSSMGEQGLAYTYFGMSIRNSQALGLGIDCSRWVKANLISQDDMQVRTWTYWTTFAQDVCTSLYVGREFGMPTPSAEVIPISEPEFDKTEWYHPPSGVPAQPSYMVSTFAATCGLLRIGREVLDVNEMVSDPATRPEAIFTKVAKLDAQFNTWRESLPEGVEITSSNRNSATPHHLMLEMAYWWLSILLHRPFYFRARTVPAPEMDIDHVKLCDGAARNIMELVSIWRKLYTLRYVPISTFGQVVFAAGTVFVESAVHAVSGTRVAKLSLRQSVDQVHTCIQYLEEAGLSFLCAQDAAGILANLLQEKLKQTETASALLHAANPSASQPPAVTGNPPDHQPGVSNEFALGQASGSLTTAPGPGMFVWDLNKPAHQPVGPDRLGSWPANRISQHGSGTAGSSSLPFSFGMEFGMRGGEMLSARPFSPHQFYGSQLFGQPEFAIEESSEGWPLPEEDCVLLMKTLNESYPYTT